MEFQITENMERENKKNGRAYGKAIKAAGSYVEPLLYILPSLLIFCVFIFYPVFKTIYLSFYYTDLNGDPSSFAGLENYAEFFKGAVFRNSLYVSLKFVLLTVPGTVAAALFLALLGNLGLKTISLFRTMFSMTISVSVATASTIWMLLYHPRYRGL